MIKLLNNSINATNRSISYLLRQKYTARDQGYLIEERQLQELIDNMKDTLKLLVDMREKQEQLQSHNVS